MFNITIKYLLICNTEYAAETSLQVHSLLSKCLPILPMVNNPTQTTKDKELFVMIPRIPIETAHVNQTGVLSLVMSGPVIA